MMCSITPWLMGRVRVVSKHMYITKCVNLNPIYLIKQIKLLNLDMTRLNKWVTRAA
jgi:hypothetical protein